jgi:hypothetical protein
MTNCFFPHLAPDPSVTLECCSPMDLPAPVVCMQGILHSPAERRLVERILEICLHERAWCLIPCERLLDEFWLQLDFETFLAVRAACVRLLRLRYLTLSIRNGVRYVRPTSQLLAEIFRVHGTFPEPWRTRPRGRATRAA